MSTVKIVVNPPTCETVNLSGKKLLNVCQDLGSRIYEPVVVTIMKPTATMLTELQQLHDISCGILRRPTPDAFEFSIDDEFTTSMKQCYYMVLCIADIAIRCASAAGKLRTPDSSWMDRTSAYYAVTAADVENLVLDQRYIQRPAVGWSPREAFLDSYPAFGRCFTTDGREFQVSQLPEFFTQQNITVTSDTQRSFHTAYPGFSRSPFVVRPVSDPYSILSLIIL